MTDHLEADTITIPGQNFACVSIVSEESNQKHPKCGLKIRGVFNTFEDASHHAKKLQKTDTSFDVFVVELYKWLLIPPELSKIENQEFTDERLNNIIYQHKQEKIRAQEVFEARKDELKTGDVDPIDGA